MKIGINLYPNFLDLPLSSLKEGLLNANNLIFAKQLGVSHVIAWMPFPPGEGFWAFDDLIQLKKFIEEYGLKLEAIENLPPLHYDKILFGLEGREEQIKNISKTINNMGKVGINCLGYSFSISLYY